VRATIGFIGLGTMGGPMCRRLVAAGHRVVAFDVVRERLLDVEAVGAVPAAAAADCAAADIVCTSLPEPSHVRDVMLGDGVLAAMRPGSVWIDLTTNRRAALLDLADGAPDGVAVVDAPVTGAVDGARTGRLTVFMGGAPDAVARVAPLLGHLGTVIACGPLGAGTVVKLVTNQLWFVAAAALGEGFAVGTAHGVDLEVLWRAILASVGDSFVARHDAPSIFAGHYDPSFTLALCTKDLRLLAELEREVAAELPLTAAARAVFVEAAHRYGPDAGELHVARRIEDDSGLSFRLDGRWTAPWEVDDDPVRGHGGERAGAEVRYRSRTRGGAPMTTTDTAVHTIDALIDLDRYPLHDLDHPARARALALAREGLAAVGCAVLPDLLRPAGLQRLRDEVAALKHTTYYSTSSINPYFSTADPSLPDDHPVNIFTEKSSGFIPGDAWGPGSPTAAVYRWPPLIAFLAEALGVGSLHCYADPLACLTVNVMDPGQQFAWHYDTNDFAVTLLVDEAGEGGLFQYAPNIRSPEHEPFDEVADVLLGRSDRVVTLDLRPGDLQIFRGRYSVHQVSRVGAGSRPRHAAIFAYTEDDGVIGRAERTRQLFGRTLDVHDDAEVSRVRRDDLMD
jgi:3-hydroxyisobutyrate dehydrogenase